MKTIKEMSFPTIQERTIGNEHTVDTISSFVIDTLAWFRKYLVECGHDVWLERFDEADATEKLDLVDLLWAFKNAFINRKME